MAENLDAKVPELRKKFLEKYSGSIIDDTYDARDVSWVEEDDRLLRAVLRTHKSGPGKVDKAVDLLNKMLLFRAKWKLNDLKESDLNKELKETNRVYYHGVDREGRQILHFAIKKQKKGHLVEEAKQYIAFYVNKEFRENPEKQLTTLFDFTDVGVGNMDLAISEFIVEIFAVHFPDYAVSNLMFKMPLVIEGIYKIIQAWMDPVQKKRTVFVKRSDIQKYVAKEELLPHMIKEEGEAKK